MTSLVPVTLVAALAVVVVIETIWIVALRRTRARLRNSLERAAEAAADAARAASLAVPGSIDSEIVLGLIRSGITPTLDMVQKIMDDRAEKEERARRVSVADADNQQKLAQPGNGTA